MTKINDGGPAFPGSVRNGANKLTRHPGMSMRDYVAVQAMTAFYSSFDVRCINLSRECLLADAAVFFNVADAFLAARSGGQDDE